MASLDRGFVVIDHVIVDLSKNIVLGAFQEAAHIGMRLKIFILVLVCHSNVSICEHRLLTRWLIVSGRLAGIIRLTLNR